MLSCNKIVCASSEIGNSRIDHGRIGTPIVNKNIWSKDDNFRVKIDVDKADKLDTIVQRSQTNEGTTASSRIKEESLESIFSKMVEESKSSEQMNLTDSARIESPKLVHFGHPPIETENVGNLLDGIIATRIENSDGIRRRTTRDDRMAHRHDIKTISEKIAYRKHIRYLEFETREVLERETSNKNIENIGTRLDKTRLDKNQMTRSMHSSKRSKNHEPEVNLEPEPLSSDSS